MEIKKNCAWIPGQKDLQLCGILGALTNLVGMVGTNQRGVGFHP
jgi:hypothetical protein